MTRKEERQQRIALSHQRKLNDKLKSEKDRLLISIIAFIGLLCGIAVPFMTVKGTTDYYEIHGSLFVTYILVILASFAIQKYDQTFFDALKKWRLSDEALTPAEASNLIWMVNFIVASIGLLMSDVSFLNHGGVRIGAVIAIAFAKVLTVLSKRK